MRLILIVGVFLAKICLPETLGEWETAVSRLEKIPGSSYAVVHLLAQSEPPQSLEDRVVKALELSLKTTANSRQFEHQYWAALGLAMLGQMTPEIEDEICRGIERRFTLSVGSSKRYTNMVPSEMKLFGKVVLPTPRIAKLLATRAVKCLHNAGATVLLLTLSEWHRKHESIRVALQPLYPSLLNTSSKLEKRWETRNTRDSKQLYEMAKNSHRNLVVLCPLEKFSTPMARPPVQ